MNKTTKVAAERSLPNFNFTAMPAQSSHRYRHATVVAVPPSPWISTAAIGPDSSRDAPAAGAAFDSSRKSRLHYLAYYFISPSGPLIYVNAASAERARYKQSVWSPAFPMIAPLEEWLLEAEAHLVQLKSNVDWQREMVAKLESQGRDTTQPREVVTALVELVVVLQDALAIHTAHRNALREELKHLLAEATEPA